MDRSPEHNDSGKTAGVATLENSGYTFSRLGLVPCDLDAPSPQAEESVATVSSPATVTAPAPTPIPVPPSAVRMDPPAAPKPAWRETPTTSPTPATAHTEEDPMASQPAGIAGEEDFVRVTVKVPRALRDILRSCAKNTHQYQYVLVIEALADFLVQLPEDVQRQLLRDVNGEAIKKHISPSQPAVPTSNWKRMWKRWFSGNR